MYDETITLRFYLLRIGYASILTSHNVEYDRANKLYVNVNNSFIVHIVPLR